MNETIKRLQECIVDGDAESAPELVEKSLAEGLNPIQILDEALVRGADIVGERFESGEYYLPELMMTGRALKAAMDVLKPALAAQASADENRTQAKIILATVQTDIHDIGKNVVASMLTAAGFDVIDLGVDVPLPAIISKAEEAQADIIALSALLTTSMPYMKDLLDMLEARGLRSKYKVIVGGASVTAEWAASIGADGTGKNAVEAVRLVRTFTGTS